MQESCLRAPKKKVLFHRPSQHLWQDSCRVNSAGWTHQLEREDGKQLRSSIQMLSGLCALSLTSVEGKILSGIQDLASL